MKSHYILITILIFFFNNILIWYQLNGQLVWGFWKSWKGIVCMLLMGIPISGLFYMGTRIERVSDEKASRLFSEGYKYVAKSIWKEKVRDLNKEPEVNEETDKTEMVTKSNKMSKAAKRHSKQSK